MLVLAQPTTKGHTSLPMTVNEVKVVEQFTPPNQLLRLGEAGTSLTISNSNRTVEDATIHLAQTSILHLACHGHQDRGDPLNSGFELEDGRLTLAKLIGCHTPNAFLAFLSACESASNDLSIPDETLNLAAGMIYAGEYFLISL
jgi:CHAT domain-containing protein